MALTADAIVERFSAMLQLASGNGKTEVTGLASPETATATSLIFIGDKKHLEAALRSPARVWVVQKPLAQAATAAAHDRTVITTPNSQLAMALIGKVLFPQRKNLTAFDGTAIHPSAVIHPTASLGENVLVGPNATIASGVRIGADSIVGPNTTIEAEVVIGERTHIHPQVYIAFSSQIGNDCEIHPQTSIGTEGFGYAHDQTGKHHRLTHYGRVVIEDRVHIGAGVQIDRGTFEDSRIGMDTIIDNHCHFGHNIKIGKGTIITGGLLAAGSVTIGERCLFGGRTTIAGHLTIAPGCQFAGLTAIPSSVTKPGQYGGYPPIPLKQALKVTSSMAHLPKMRKTLKRILKHLNLEDETDSE